MLKHIDLFSGIGGFALGAKLNNIETTQFVEIDKFCQKVLQHNFPSVPIHDDITTFHPVIDSNNAARYILTGGFPCQPFSLAGAKRGGEDSRFLWHEMFRVVRELRPKWVLIENVSGLATNKFRMELLQIYNDLESQEYKFQTFNIPAYAVGLPHERKRLWIVANANSDGLHRRMLSEKEKKIQAVFASIERFFTPKICQWSEIKHAKPLLYRKHDGLPSELDRDTKHRVKALGNSICPKIAAVLFSIIKNLES